MSFNVLIVDDSSSMRGVIKKVIGMSGFRMDNCFEANHGKRAIEVLQQDWVDVIISDINMPEMNGLEMLKALNQDSLFKNIPVIIVTTEGSNERMDEAFALGAKGFIKKPFLPEDLKKALHNVLGVGDHGEYEEDGTGADGLDF